MTGEEKNVHERAVKLRKMTDDKLVEHIDHIREEAYNTGYSEAEAQRASTPAPGKTLPQLLEQLDAGECKGIKSATAYKIAEFAREQQGECAHPLAENLFHRERSADRLQCAQDGRICLPSPLQRR